MHRSQIGSIGKVPKFTSKVANQGNEQLRDDIYCSEHLTRTRVRSVLGEAKDVVGISEGGQSQLS